MLVNHYLKIWLSLTWTTLDIYIQTNIPTHLHAQSDTYIHMSEHHMSEQYTARYINHDHDL